MFNILNYVSQDDIMINPVDHMAEKMNAATRLYTKGVEMYKRKEENMKTKRLEEERDYLKELQEKPKMNAVSKDIIFKNNLHVSSKQFFEYNMDWKEKVNKRLENERKAKEEIRLLEVEEEKQRIKEARMVYLKSKNGSRVLTPTKGVGEKSQKRKLQRINKEDQFEKPSKFILHSSIQAPNF